MEEKENLVTDVTENTEETVEQTEEMVVPELKYSEEDFNNKLDEVLPKKLARREAKIRKEYEKKYGQLENVLKAGLNVDNIEEATEQLTNFYTQRGANIPTYHSEYSERDLEILAQGDYEDIINGSTYKEVEDEANRLADIGLDNMTDRERLTFNKLGKYLTEEKSKKELAAMGVDESLLKDEEFNEFSSKLNPNLSLKEKYEMYKKYKPMPKVEPIGSLKGNTGKETGVKEFYTYEEASQFTREDFDKNPELFKAVERSMTKW
jgi:hypothetical protein